MTVKELIKELNKISNKNVEVGFEHLRIVYVQDDGDYVDLGGDGHDCKLNKKKYDTGKKELY